MTDKMKLNHKESEVRFLSIVMPCLNEVLTLRTCIRRAKFFLATLDIPNEIVIADNGSTDGSIDICKEEGVRCLQVPMRGYGSALHYGIMAAKGSHIIFGDSDDSYHFDECQPFYEKLQQGADLVVGNRFKGGVEKGAMPFLHRYLGTPVISYMGRKSFKVPYRDFNCGLRAIRKASYLELGMQARGMDFITEMLARAGYRELNIAEVPVKLYKDGRDRPPHLKTWQDGWRQFRQIIMLSPRWFLLIPSLVFLVMGLLLFFALLFTKLQIAKVTFDIHSLFFGAVFILLGLQLLQFYLLLRFYGFKIRLHKLNQIEKKIIQIFRFEKGLIIGCLVFVFGVLLSFIAVYQWATGNYGNLDPMHTFRLIIPGGLGIMAGTQVIIFSFLLNALVTFNISFKEEEPNWIN
ncbi:glycosyltransferase family 2 protein [Flavihumibacter profundi]|uniref:glycosyltransferase family 2 protein n=1 Tax=Flavihumibacter profundi TaxID=2716883 RepID=UPI001CC63B22|nr:glycosyltransferase family 2 protein [Flavihumibacter profundi]MBZ5857455.1 glycosyltransferase family 2 protein [Flavihumibacter profundi]